MTDVSKDKVKLSNINYELVQPLLNDTFELVIEQEAVVEVTLVEVEKRSAQSPCLHSWQKPKAGNTNKRSPFTLVFRFPVEFEAIQRGYGLAHPDKGAFEEMLLTPIAVDENGIYLEAIFN